MADLIVKSNVQEALDDHSVSAELFEYNNPDRDFTNREHHRVETKALDAQYVAQLSQESLREWSEY